LNSKRVPAILAGSYLPPELSISGNFSVCPLLSLHNRHMTELHKTMSSSPEICPYDSSCHLKEAMMQRRYVRHYAWKQVMPTGPELSVQLVEH